MALRCLRNSREKDQSHCILEVSSETRQQQVSGEEFKGGEGRVGINAYL